MTDRFSDATLTGRGEDIAADFSACTLEEEAVAGGWTRITKPVGGEPERAITAGMRGEPDMDDDLGEAPYTVG